MMRLISIFLLLVSVPCADAAYMSWRNFPDLFNASEPSPLTPGIDGPGSIVSNAAGTQLTVSFDMAVQKGANYADNIWDFYDDGTESNPTYVSGDGTDTWVYSVSTAIAYGSVCYLKFKPWTTPDVIEAVVGGADLEKTIDDAICLVDVSAISAPPVPTGITIGDPADYDTLYYVDSDVVGGADDGSSWANAFDSISDLVWDDIRDDLVTGSVAIYFKGTFTSQLTILGEGCSYSGGSYICTDYNTDYNTNNRLYVGKHPSYTGPTITATSITYPILFGKCGYLTIAGWTVTGDLTRAGQTLIHGCALDDGPSVSSGHIHIVNNTLTNAGQYNLMLRHSSDYNIIEGNTITGGGNAIYLGEERKSGGPHISSCGVIRNNTISSIDPTRTIKKDAHFFGLQGICNYIIEDNTCESSGNVGAAIWCWSKYSRTRKNVFRNNFIKDTYKAGVTLRAEPTDYRASYGNLVYGNTFINNGSYEGATPQGTININEQKPESGQTGARVFNNTIYDVYGVGIYGEDIDEGEYFNNIIHHSNAGASTTAFVLVDSTASSLDPDYNLYLFDGLSSAGSYWNFNGVKNWATYSTSYETNAPTPLDDDGTGVWTDPTSDDFTLSSTHGVNAGKFFTTITQATGSGTSATVDDPSCLHGNKGLLTATNTDIDGMLVSLYDSTHGLRDAEIVTVSGSTITFADSESWVEDVTKIGYRFSSGTSPNIGAE